MAYVVDIKSSAERDLRRLTKQNKLQGEDLGNVGKCIADLAEIPKPPGAEKLKGTKKGKDAWRVRVGVFRILYRVDKRAETVTVYMVDDRKDVYKKK